MPLILTRKGSKGADPEAFWTHFLLNKGIKLINITLTVVNIKLQGKYVYKLFSTSLPSNLVRLSDLHLADKI